MIKTVLVSGKLSKKRLDRVLEEIRRIATRDAKNGELVLVFDSSDGNPAAALRFLDGLLGDDLTRRLAERAKIKIYAAQSVAALLAFTLGCDHELSATSEVVFDVGERKAQVGKSDECGLDIRLSAGFVEEWREYYSAVTRLMERVGLFDDLYETFLACEFRLHLSAEECLRRGLVGRLF